MLRMHHQVKDAKAVELSSSLGERESEPAPGC